jgi:hypothetical protein
MRPFFFMHPLLLCLLVLLFQATCSLATTALFLHHAPAPAARISSTRRTHGSNPRTYSLRMGLFTSLDRLENAIYGALFPNVEEPTKENPFKELACFENLVTGKEIETNVAYDSLTKYLQLWAFALQQDPKALATPITTSEFKQQVEQSLDEDGNGPLEDLVDDNIKKSTCMKIMFRPPKRYLSYKEQKGLEKGRMPDRKGGKVDAWSPGGMQLTVQIETLEEESAELRLVAKRCDIDGDTIIKLTSERAIIRRLNEAIRIWKKVRAMPNK